MKYLLTLLLLTSIVKPLAMYEESDKQKHFAVSAAIGFASSNVAHYYGLDNHYSFWVGLGAVFIVGLGKELYDSRNGGSGFDMRDMTANMLGGTVGSIPIFVIYEF